MDMAKGQKTGGRAAGTPNKVTADIKALAQSFGPDAIRKLAQLSGLAVDDDGNRVPAAESGTTQVAALKELLDRGYGKAKQEIEHSGGAFEALLAQLGE
jgi:hypothetical protein